jgi:hypothetical protein
LAITVDTDTYISLSDADTYVGENYISTATEYTTWDALSDSDKEIYLKKATKKIDRQILRGVKAVVTQTLEFPRAIPTDLHRTERYSNVTIATNGDYVVESAVTQRVKDAQVEEALSLALADAGSGANAGTRKQLQAQGVKEFELGDLREVYGSGVSTAYNSTVLLSAEAKELLKYYITCSVVIV